MLVHTRCNAYVGRGRGDESILEDYSEGATIPCTWGAQYSAAWAQQKAAKGMKRVLLDNMGNTKCSNRRQQHEYGVPKENKRKLQISNVQYNALQKNDTKR